MKKYFLLLCVLISQTYSMEPEKIVRSHNSYQHNADLYNSCKRSAPLAGALGCGLSAIAWLDACPLPKEMDILSTPSPLSMSERTFAGTLHYAPPICCCTLATLLFCAACNSNGLEQTHEE